MWWWNIDDLAIILVLYFVFLVFSKWAYVFHLLEVWILCTLLEIIIVIRFIWRLWDIIVSSVIHRKICGIWIIFYWNERKEAIINRFMSTFCCLFHEYKFIYSIIHVGTTYSIINIINNNVDCDGLVGHFLFWSSSIIIFSRHNFVIGWCLVWIMGKTLIKPLSNWVRIEKRCTSSRHRRKAYLKRNLCHPLLKF